MLNISFSFDSIYLFKDNISFALRRKFYRKLLKKVLIFISLL